MQRRLALSAAVLAAWGPVLSAWGADPMVWVLSSEAGGAYAEAASLIRAEIGSDVRIDWWQGTLRDLPAAPAVLPKAVVVLGTAALRWAVDKVHADAAWSRVPVLAALLPRAGFDAIVAAKPVSNISAVLLDQPVERYFELLRHALPGQRRVGVLLGHDTRHLKSQLNRAATTRGMSLVTASVQDADLYTALQSVLNEADVLLLLPDSSLFDAGALQNMLITAYRRRVPVLTYSAAHVRAGATLALHTTPAQAARQTSGVLRDVLRGASLPATRLSEPFSVAINTTVARSLGLALESEQVLEGAIRRQESAR